MVQPGPELLILAVDLHSEALKMHDVLRACGQLLFAKGFQRLAWLQMFWSINLLPVSHCCNTAQARVLMLYCRSNVVPVWITNHGHGLAVSDGASVDHQSWTRISSELWCQCGSPIMDKD
eukprot:1147065-Pelagomonas_calceolata.AAC.4